MDFSKIVPTLAAVAPTIATALGTPVAGLAVSALESLFGLDQGTSANDPTKLTQAVIGMSPDTAAQVRKADQDFAVKMKQLDIDVETLAAKDRDSARAMQSATKDITPRLLAVAISVMLFFLLVSMAFFELPAKNQNALMMLLGALVTGWTAVVSFYFGSSSSSQAKDATIKALVK